MNRALFAATALALALALPVPAAARGYKDHLRHHPRLTFDARDGAHTTRVRDRIQAQERPWSDGYADLRDRAERGRAVHHTQHAWKQQRDRWAVLYGQEVQNGLVARAKAAVAWLYLQGVDPTWRPLPRLPGEATPEGWVRQQVAEAVSILDGAYDDFPGWRGFGVLNRGIVSAESLLVHAQAWDLLAALPPALRPQRLAPSRSRLTAFAEDHHFYRRLISGEKDNHKIRYAAGLGVAGILFNRHDRYRWWKPATWWADPRDWVRRAERILDPERRGSMLRYQIEPGSYGEGSSYHAYSESLYSPFFLAYTRFDGGRSFLASARLDRVHRWSVAIRLPDGLRPPIDDGKLVGFRGGAWHVNQLRGGSRDADQRRLFGWDWVDQGYPGARGARALGLLAAWDPSPQDAAAIAAASAPDESAFLRAEGTAALRTGGGRGAAYALLLAEHDRAREAGTGHEHPDPLAYFLYAEEDVLALAPGYPGWARHDLVNRAEHNNLVLVDGEGPKGPARRLTWKARGADAFLEVGSGRTFHSPTLQSVEARTEYRRVALRRTLSLVGGRALVVEDRAESQRGFWPWSRPGRHDLTALFHASAGGKKRTPAVLSPLGLSFASHRRGVPVEVAVSTTRGRPRLELGTAFDAVGAGQDAGGADEHAVLRATIDDVRRANLLTLVVWGPPGQAPARPELLLDVPGATALGASSGGLVVLALSQEERGAVTVSATATTPALETDGTLAVAALTGGQVTAAVAHDATYLRLGGQTWRRNGVGTIRR